jgi:hypothetical protein
VTILIVFHTSRYRTFKAYDIEQVLAQWRGEFPYLESYPRFMALLPSVLVPLLAYLHTRLGTCTGMGFLDSASLAVYHPARIQQHRVFAARARRGKASVGWFYGIRLHLVVNDRGELLAFCLTPGNVDDRRPLPTLLQRVRRLFGRLFADRGYISQALTAQLLAEAVVRLVTKGARTCTTACWTSPTSSCCANEPSSRPSPISSRTTARSSIPVIAAPQLPRRPRCATHRLLPSAHEARPGSLPSPSRLIYP